MGTETRQRTLDRRHGARPRPLALVALFTLAAAVPVTAQSPAAQDASVEPAPEAYAAITGLYELEDGRRLSVFDVVDQLREHQLVAVEPGSGRARTLYPVSDTVFEAGSGWFAPDPREYRLRFGREAGGRISSVEWEPVDEPDRINESVDAGSVKGRRIRFRQREVEFGDGEVSLSGTIVLPASEDPHPGVVIVHGSGPLTRRVPRYMAELFAHRGIAALVYDKRGTGESTGEWRGASYLSR
jgi:predicted nucleic acid-binding Zn ribbon protein